MAPALDPKLLDHLRMQGVEVLVERHSPRFQDLLKRWTDIDRQTPAAIILPESGGYSQWSTIGEHGIIIDLSKYSGISVDAAGRKATLVGSVLSKAVAVALAAEGFFTVGAIPYFLGGGASITSSITGYGSDQILGARMIDATGKFINVTEEAEPDLLYAIRGAGQFFGLVTELTIKIRPLKELGNEEGVIWAGVFTFPLHRARDVALAVEKSGRQ
ncbi:hypothetical protein F5Y17DRAFT_456345 [Xylariaceae sp. FL0594]|nr:hypothetical protein F5Y17DRAFT_456345 [Xylariaceae sp. FL0594]